MCIRINNFLCCFTLRTGGLVIGWLTLIIELLATIFCTAVFAGFLILSCENFQTLLSELGIYHLPRNFHRSCEDGRYMKIYIGIGLFTITVSLIAALIGFLCIYGTLKRQTGKIKPLMYLLAFGIFLYAIGMLSLETEAIISGLFSIIVDTYLFICLYSLISQIQEENSRGYVNAV